MKIGPYYISELVTHHLALDGGAMFGAVPKALWQKVIAADERNRIPMLTRLLVLESQDAKILIDLGCGDKFSEKVADIYDINRQTDTALHQVISDITHVIITHLHFDHVGGVSYLDSSAELQLSFPKAEHIVSAAHWQYAARPNIREKASFFKQNLEPLAQAKLRKVSNGEEVLPNIRVWESFGHTKGMLWLEIFDENKTLAYAADVVPTAHHLPLPYIMGYDMCAETMVAEKEAFLQRAADPNWIVVFEHDRDTAAARIELVEGRARVVETVKLPKYK